MPDIDIFEDDKGENKDDLLDPTKAKKVEDNDDKTADQLLNSIVKEDGTPKYNTVEDALKAASEAQKHIKALESDNAELRDKGNASDKLDELLDAVKQSKDSGQGGDDSSTMNPEDVLTIVKDFFSDNKAAETRSGNINTVTKAFKDRYGKDASKELYGKAEDLGFSRDEINGMIAKNPNAALKVLGVDIKKAPNVDPATTVGGVGTGNFRETPETKPDSIMEISSSKALTDAWNASKARTLKRLGIES